jgi:hypothetical protein
MKQWPPSPARIDINEALPPLLRVINTGHPAYDGYDIGEDTKATCISPDEFLNDADGSGLTSLRGRALIVAFQLGVEQGRRLYPTRVVEGLRPAQYLVLVRAAQEAYLEATGWKPYGETWAPPGGGPPIAFVEAWRATGGP